LLSQIEIASGGGGVGGDEVIGCSIRHMVADEVSGVIIVVDVPERTVRFDLKVGRAVKVGSIALKIAPDDVPLAISGNRAPSGKMSEASNGGRTIGFDGNRGGGLAGGPPSKGEPVELTQKADLGGISWDELGNNRICALQMSATNKGGDRPRCNGIRSARSSTATIRIDGSGEGEV
jgi:hypothetical protein